MPLDTAKIAIRGTTQEHLEIEDILDNLLLLKDGSVAMVIGVAAVNFGLLSPQEQEAIIFAYAGFLNSLNFAVQIVIRSKRKDITAYVAQLDTAEQKQINSLLKGQIAKYKEFIIKTVKENNVLDKKFYILVPFSSLELGAQAGAKLLTGQKGLPLPKGVILEKARVALRPKGEHVLRQLAGLGLKARQLTTAELVEIFFEIYNPNVDKGSMATVGMYTAPIVSSH